MSLVGDILPPPHSGCAIDDSDVMSSSFHPAHGEKLSRPVWNQ